MKCQLVRLLTLSFAIVALAPFASTALAQGKGGGKGGGGNGGGGEEPPTEIGIGYRVHWASLPPETLSVYPQDFAFTTDANGNGSVALVVGYYHRSDRIGRSAFVYDHFGLIDDSQPRKFWDIFELIGPSFPSWVPSTHQESAFFGVNSSGRVCGYVRSGAITDHFGCQIDLAAETLKLKQLPDFYSTAVASIGRRVNEVGDILLIGTSSGDFWNQTEISVYNPESGHLIHVRRSASEPFFVHGAVEFNSALDVVGEQPLETRLRPIVRHRVSEDDIDANGVGISYTDSGTTTEFDSYLYPTAINEFGQFGAEALVPIKRNRTESQAARVGADGSVEWSQKLDYLSLGGYVDDINNSGDLIYADRDNLGVSYYLHEGDPSVSGDETFVSDFESMIVAESDPLSVFATSDLASVRVSHRDITGFGWIIGNVEVGTNFDGSPHRVLAILIPETLP